MADRVVFLRPDAERIARVVRTVEAGNRNETPLRFRKVDDGGGGKRVFRVCTFTGAWPKNSLNTVTFKYQSSTPNTVAALNLFAAIGTASSSRNCAIAREGTAWFLVAAEC